ncbi:uncharacterized protein LOC124361465 [Homalodisca vitripennis]|uniref:uncharacterized protein LOC124361465 n=1 Tax=Homalodisca vitripennis TaxID=197043 RepID=UPI001EE9B400|nr:uncharacterized protein LOC124361465 [Homalodisca vitripennis]
MNWALLVLTVLARRCLCAYQQYEHQQQSTGYRGPPVLPVILPGGFIADTEEVARAKDLHFNAFAHAASSVKDTRYNAAEDVNARYTQPVRQQLYTPQQSYSQPQRQQDYNVPQQYTGPSRSTYPEKNTQVINYQQPAYSSQPRYQGPPVIPVILPNGYIAETADVEAAKEQHFQLVAKAQAAVARAQERASSKKYGYSGTYTREDDGGQDYEEPEQNYNQVYRPAPQAPLFSPPRKPYQGPPVVPVVLPSGHIADTAEVAAAKISHLQQLLDAAQKSQPQQRYHTSV